MHHERFAERAARRLESEANALEYQGRSLRMDGKISGIPMRARELRLAAYLVREEAEAASNAEVTSGQTLSADTLGPVDEPPLEAQA